MEEEVKDEGVVETVDEYDYQKELNRYRQIEMEREAKKNRRKKTVGKFFSTLLLVFAVAVAGIGGGYFGNALYHRNHTETKEVENHIVYQAVERVDKKGEAIGVLTIPEIAELCASSIVEITTKTVNQFWFQTYTSEGAGSGVIYTADGYIITNNHVIENASQIGVVTPDGTYYEAKLVATDATMDLAVIKIEAENLTPAVFAADDSVKVGDTAVAIGNPLGNLGGTVTSGIVSALDRELTLENETHNLMQISASINPGNSGGGVFNDHGELIGVVIAKSTRTSNGIAVEGIGFAIPIADVKTTVEALITNGYVGGRAYIGVGLTEIPDSQTAQMYGFRNLGVYITEVVEGSPAETAGLQANDYIVSINGEQFTTIAEMKSILSKLDVGDIIEMILVRDGKTFVTKVTLGEREM